MNTEITEISPTQKELKIEIEPEAVREVYNKVSQKYAKGAQVDGFRKGYAPLDVVRMRFRDQIRSEVLQEIVSQKVTQAIQENDLNPLAEPHLHLEDAENVKVNGSQPLVLKAHIEVMPEIPMPEYKNLEAVRRVRPLEEGEVERIIDERRQQFATLIPVEDRKSEEGDTVIVDLEGAFPEEPNTEPIKADNLEIKLGDDAIEKSFTENLVGVAEDEEKEFTVAYPAEFTSPALAGKTVNYRAKIKSVGRVELPEADDEWAQSLGENYESMADLRGKLNKDLEAYSKDEADNRVRNDLIAKLIESNEFEIPNSLIDVQARNLLNNFAQDLQQRGVDVNQVEKDFIQMAYNQMRGQAERDVRGAMLLEKIAEQENVEVSDEEITEEIQKIAAHYRATPEAVRASLAQQGGEDGVANSLRTRKAVEALMNNAKITDGEWIDESKMPVENTGEESEASSDSATENRETEEKKKTKATKPKAEKSESETNEAKEPKKKAAKKAKDS